VFGDKETQNVTDKIHISETQSYHTKRLAGSRHGRRERKGKKMENSHVESSRRGKAQFSGVCFPEKGDGVKKNPNARKGSAERGGGGLKNTSRII